MQVRKPYEKPVIIFQDVLKTRAGSPLDGTDAADPFDPAQIFGDG